jgi:hypothetical protein
MTDNERYDMTVTVLETADQELCARLLAQEFPRTPKHEMEDVIRDCERDLPQMGFNENLALLRRELAVIHPMWK